MIDDLKKQIEHAVALLQEHCTSITILASVQEGGNTHSIIRGYGDWYARQGLAHEFINTDKSRDAAFEIAKALKNES